LISCALEFEVGSLESNSHSSLQIILFLFCFLANVKFLLHSFLLQWWGRHPGFRV
jgi:hypothetical protein